MDLQPNKTDGIYLPITNTRISASEWNQLVGSCMAFITEAGLTPDASDNEQFLNAFKTIAAGIGSIGANTNLSNLTATGEARFTTKANTDLSNVSATGASTGAGWAMPSDVYEDLTLGASGSTYTAPANGYISLLTSTSAAGGFFALYNGYYNIVAQHTAANYALTGVLPIRKGQTATLDYLNIATPTHFKFIYAEGSKSEAN